MFVQIINAAPIAAIPIATTEPDILTPNTAPLVESDAAEPFAEFVPLADAVPVALATLLDALDDAEPVDEAADCEELEEAGTVEDADADAEETTLVELTPDEVEAAVTPEAVAPFPSAVRVAQLDEEGAGWAAGVDGSP